MVTKSYVGLQEPRSLRLRGMGPRASRAPGRKSRWWGISELPTPLIPPVGPLLSLPSPDDSGLQRSGLLEQELHHANKKIRKKERERKLALESFNVRKMTLKPASRVLSELKVFVGAGVHRGSGVGWACDLAAWIF